MVGSACWSLLKNNDYINLIGKSSKELDLKNQNAVELFIKNEKPDIIIDAAAKVGGIWANNEYPYDFLMENMLIQNNLIKCAFENNISKFIFLGRSCVYPKNCPQPIKEEYLLTDSLEKTNQWYAIAKISGIKLCESIFNNYNRQFISLMPTNLYGPNDNFELKTSHVLPAMIKKFHDAKINGNKEVHLWGDGTPLREFLYTEDVARAVLFACENNLKHHIYNVGSGDELSIKDLASKVKGIIGFSGKINWNKLMPNGTQKKLLDSKRLNSIGWSSKVDLEDGINNTYKWYLKSLN